MTTVDPGMQAVRAPVRGRGRINACSLPAVIPVPLGPTTAVIVRDRGGVLIDTGNPALSVGIGPQITAPTASKDALGSEQWSAGLVHTLFNASSPKIQYGYLLSWQASFTGADDRNDVNLGAFQPFVFYQLGGGTYLRSTAVMAYDFEHSSYSVPIGLGIGQVVPREKVVFNVFIEPQVSVADDGAGWPKWQVFVGLNTQFK